MVFYSRHTPKPEPCFRHELTEFKVSFKNYEVFEAEAENEFLKDFSVHLSDDLRAFSQ